MEQLTSIQNPTVQRMRSLKTAKGRGLEGLMLVEGEKMLLEALNAGLVPADAFFERECALSETLRQAGARVYLVPRKVIEAVSDTVTPSSCCASFTPGAALDIQRPPALLVALDSLQDPGNVGTIWRTADAAGFGGLILGSACDPNSPKVVRASMGSAFRLPVCTTDDLPGMLGELKQQGYQVIATELSGTDIYQRQPLCEKTVVVIGSEARGISEEISNMADIKLRLPMRGGAESLNAAVAAGIILYELTRGMDQQ